MIIILYNISHSFAQLNGFNYCYLTLIILSNNILISFDFIKWYHLIIYFILLNINISLNAFQ